MESKKYLWGAVPLVLVSAVLAAISIGGGVSAPALAQGVGPAPDPCVPHPRVHRLFTTHLPHVRDPVS